MSTFLQYFPGLQYRSTPYLSMEVGNGSPEQKTNADFRELTSG